MLLDGPDDAGAQAEVTEADAPAQHQTSDAVAAPAPPANEAEQARQRRLRLLAGVKQEAIDALIKQLAEQGHMNESTLRQACELLRLILKVDTRSRNLLAVRTSAFLAATDTKTMQSAVNRAIEKQLKDINSRIVTIHGEVVKISDRTKQLEDLSAALQGQLSAVLGRLSGLRQLVAELRDAGKFPGVFVVVPDIPAQLWRLSAAGASDRTASNAQLDESASFIGSLTELFVSSKPVAWCRERFAERRLRLKLVCQRCSQPQGDGYAISQPGEWMAKLAPALQVRPAARIAPHWQLAAPSCVCLICMYMLPMCFFALILLDDIEPDAAVLNRPQVALVIAKAVNTAATIAQFAFPMVRPHTMCSYRQPTCITS